MIGHKREWSIQVDDMGPYTLGQLQSMDISDLETLQTKLWTFTDSVYQDSAVKGHSLISTLIASKRIKLLEQQVLELQAKMSYL